MQVCAQDPIAGRQVETGSTVSISIIIGWLETAARKGYIRDITGMTAGEAISYLDTIGIIITILDKVYFSYVYSDTVEPGYVVNVTYIEAVSEGTDGQLSMCNVVNISSGPDDASPPLGVLRHAYLDRFGSLWFSLASADADGDMRKSVNHIVRVSADDGATWTNVTSNRIDSYFRSPHLYPKTNGDNESKQPYQDYIFDAARALIKHPELTGKYLRVRLERRHRDYNISMEESLVDFYDISQTVRVTYEDEEIRVDTAESIPLEEAKQLYDEGRFRSAYTAKAFFEKQYNRQHHLEVQLRF